MIRTGIYATQEEADEIKELTAHARSMPHHKGLWESCYKRLHAIAMSHGLPEIPGYYGFDPTNNEFVSVSPPNNLESRCPPASGTPT